MIAVQTTCALGVVRDFKELAKYNLRMLTNPELEKKPPSSKEAISKPEADTSERPVQEAPRTTTTSSTATVDAVTDKLKDPKTADLQIMPGDVKEDP